MATAKKTAVAKAIELKEKNYRLLEYQPLTFTLKVGQGNRLLVFDEEKGYNRAIRHCPNEKSIFVDEQSNMAVTEPIIFLKGLYGTAPTQVITQKFLDAHPKRDNIFALIDDAADAAELMDYEELQLDVKQAIRKKAKEEAGIDELRIIVSVLISDVKAASKMTAAEIKTTLYDLVESNLNRFVDDDGNITVFDDVEIQRAALTEHAFNSGVIRTSADGAKIMWTDNQATISHVPNGKSPKEYFARFLGTEEGLQVAREISLR